MADLSAVALGFRGVAEGNDGCCSYRGILRTVESRARQGTVAESEDR